MRFSFRSTRFQTAAKEFLRTLGCKRSNVEIKLSGRGFRGAFLPAERSLRADGFDAKWKVRITDGLSAIVDEPNRQRAIHDATVSIHFRRAILVHLDAYRYVERSIKYGVLFLVLFSRHSFFEATARQKIILSIFMAVRALFVLPALLSISEFIDFSWPI